MRVGGPPKESCEAHHGTASRWVAVGGATASAARSATRSGSARPRIGPHLTAGLASGHATVAPTRGMGAMRLSLRSGHGARLPTEGERGRAAGNPRGCAGACRGGGLRTYTACGGRKPAASAPEFPSEPCGWRGRASGEEGLGSPPVHPHAPTDAPTKKWRSNCWLQPMNSGGAHPTRPWGLQVAWPRPMVKTKGCPRPREESNSDPSEANVPT